MLPSFKRAAFSNTHTVPAWFGHAATLCVPCRLNALSVIVCIFSEKQGDPKRNCHCALIIYE